MRSTLINWILRAVVGIVPGLVLPFFPNGCTDSLASEDAEKVDRPGFDDPRADSIIQRNAWWGTFNLGAGALNRSGGGLHQDKTTFFGGLEGGYVVHPQVLLGIELSGWLLEATNRRDADEGEGAMQVFLTTRFYPIPDSGLFVKVGGGYVSHWNMAPGEPRRQEGWGLNVGAGYDVLLTESLPMLPFVSPFVTYSFGEAGNLHHDVITGGIGLTLTGKGE